MLIRTLELKNYRGFEHLLLTDMDPRLTVFVGINGGGKTTVLDALSQLCEAVHARVLNRSSSAGKERDVRLLGSGQYAPFASCSASFDVRGKVVEVRRVVRPRGFPAPEEKSRFSGDDVVDEIQRDNLAGRWDLPMAVRYGVSRAVLDVPQRIRRASDSSALGAYRDALSGGGASFRDFFSGFRALEDLENERIRRDPTYRNRALEAIRAAVEQITPGFRNLHVRRQPHRMVVTKGLIELEIDALSDGELCLIAMVGDLALRLALANTAPGNNPLHNQAIVMVDEVDLHLHPGLQRVVVERLLRAFPNCQFLLTTHSPQVLASVPTKSVIVLKNFVAERPAMTVTGRDSNAILQGLMGDAERPANIRRELDAISGLVDNEQYDRARASLDNLAEKISEADQDVVRLRTLIAFLEDQT